MKIKTKKVLYLFNKTHIDAQASEKLLEIKQKENVGLINADQVVV